MGIIVQSSSNNVASHTVLVVPISSSLKLYPTHERIQKGDIKTGKLDKLPSKAKGDQLTCIDKARMLYKIGSVTDDFMQRYFTTLMVVLLITKVIRFDLRIREILFFLHRK